ILGRGQRMLTPALEHKLPILSEPVVENVGGCDQRALVLAAAKLKRTEFDLQLVDICDRRVGGVKWAVRECLLRCGERKGTSQEWQEHLHGKVFLHCHRSRDTSESIPRKAAIVLRLFLCAATASDHACR